MIFTDGLNGIRLTLVLFAGMRLKPEKIELSFYYLFLDAGISDSSVVSMGGSHAFTMAYSCQDGGLDRGGNGGDCRSASWRYSCAARGGVLSTNRRVHRRYNGTLKSAFSEADKRKSRTSAFLLPLCMD